MLTNLAGNALRHGTEGEPAQVRVLDEGPRVAVEGRNGGQVPDSVREHLFDPFRSGGQQARASLGLYIAQQIARAHGGEVRLTSSDAAGTVLRLELPR